MFSFIFKKKFSIQFADNPKQYTWLLRLRYSAKEFNH